MAKSVYKMPECVLLNIDSQNPIAESMFEEPGKWSTGPSEEEIIIIE